MNLFKLFCMSIFNIPKLNLTKKLPFFKAIIYLFILSVISAVPITKQLSSVMHDVKEDGQKIAKKLPDFSIEEGKFITDKGTEGFIYQTNSIIFTFDPEGKRSLTDVQSDLIGNVIGIAFLKNSLVFVLPGSSTADSVVGSNQIEVPYADGMLDGLNKTNLKDALDHATIPFWIKAIFFVLSLYPMFINLLFNILILTTAAFLYSKMRAYTLRFLEILKIVTFCSTLPIIVSSVFHWFNNGFDDSMIFILATFAFFILATREEPRNIPS